MAIAIRLSKGSRDYIPKNQRVEFWEERIETLKQELKDIPYDQQDKKDSKEKEIEAVKEAFKEAKFFLDKLNGPTVFKIHSAKQSEISNTMPKHLKKRFINASEELGVSVDTIEYSKELAIHICKIGIDSWSNLVGVDSDGSTAVIEYSVDVRDEVIEQLPEDVRKDLSDEISGAISRESIKN